MDLEPNGDPPIPRGLTRWAPAAVVGCAVLVGIWAVARERGEIADALHQLHWWSVPLSFVACFAGLLAIFRSWACLLSDTGADVDLRAAIRIYAIGQAGKYVPGSVWSIVSQVQLGREYGISRVRMASASLVALLVSVTVAIAAGCLLLPFSGGEAMSRYWFAPLVAVLFAALLWPPVLNVALGWAGRLVRSPGDHSHSGSAIATSAGWAVLANLLFGVHVMAIAQGLGVNGVRGYLLSTCAYALAAGL